MKVRFLIKDSSQSPQRWQLSQTPHDEFYMLAPGFLPWNSGEFFHPPTPTCPASWGDGEWDTVCGGTGPFVGCLASHSWVWWGGRGDTTCWEKHSKACTVSAVLSPTSSVVSPILECQDNLRLPDLMLLRTHLFGKPFRMPSPNHPFLRPLTLSTWFSLYIYHMMKNRMISPKAKNKARMSNPTTSTDYCTGESMQCSQVRKGNSRALTGVAQLAGHHPIKRKLPVQFPVRAHAGVQGLVPIRGVCNRQQIDVSLSHRCFSPPFSFSFPLSKNK